MTKKNIAVLIVAVLVVGAAYYYMYKDSFYKPGIHIFHAFRPRPAALAKEGAAAFDDDAIIFGLEETSKLTVVKVVPLNELETNKFAHPTWDMVSDSNSAPVKKFFYGSRIRGMHPTVKGATADPLLANVTYRLFVESGSLKGYHDFTITDENHLSQ